MVRFQCYGLRGQTPFLGRILPYLRGVYPNESGSRRQRTGQTHSPSLLLRQKIHPSTIPPCYLLFPLLSRKKQMPPQGFRVKRVFSVSFQAHYSKLPPCMARQDCKKSVLRIKIPFSSQLSTPPLFFFCTDLQRLSFSQNDSLYTCDTHSGGQKSHSLQNPTKQGLQAGLQRGIFSV